ncbi:MAG TPA: GNAT family N-acetyltransferase [Kofleriaceae bacterium]|nr:GNAT family N-acetyltransferase [Kofleriaceae bacterium]
MRSEVWLPARLSLPDNTLIDIRELRASDGPGVRTWFRSLSPESRYQRFGAPTTDLPDAQWRYLTRIDGIKHVAVVALHDGAYVGIGRMVLLDDVGRTAEVAFLVDDAWQRRGLGSLLRDVLIANAREREIARLYAWVLPGNLAIRKLLAPAAARVVDRGDVLELMLH